MLHPATLQFLLAIKEHNSRKYFASIKPLYEEIMLSIKDFATALIAKLDVRDLSGHLVDAKDCLFRIYRDARRLKEWDLLYKENFGFVISPRGKKDTAAGYYVHIQPWWSFFACGVYRPRPDDLRRLRTHLTQHGDEYIRLVSDKKFVKKFWQVEGDVSRSMPRGFAADVPHADLVRRKQHLIYRHYTDEEVLADDFYDRILDDCRTVKPWADFLNTASLPGE